MSWTHVGISDCSEVSICNDLTLVYNSSIFRVIITDLLDWIIENVEDINVGPDSIKIHNHQ